MLKKLITKFTGSSSRALEDQSYKQVKKNVPLIDECIFCGNSYITDLCRRYNTCEYNYYCNYCHAHYFKGRWWTVPDWEDYIINS